MELSQFLFWLYPFVHLIDLSTGVRIKSSPSVKSMGKLKDTDRPPHPRERKHRRFDLRYPVDVRFALGNSISEIRAVSNNISVGGVLLEAEAKIPQHCDVSFTMTVLGHHIIGPTQITGEGHVVRIEPHRSGAGFAIAVRCKHPLSKLEEFVPARR